MTARLIEDVDVVMFVGDPAELRERLEIEVGWPDELPMPPQASFAVIISIPGSSAPGSKAEFDDPATIVQILDLALHVIDSTVL